MRRFHTSDAYVRSVIGPIGSGKTSALCCEVMLRALRQAPFHGVRRSRWAILRNTYPELRSTTIPTWRDWFGRISAFVMSQAPISCTVSAAINDGTSVELEVLFIALDIDAQVKKLLSMELTGAFISEAREVRWSTVEALLERIGRFPPQRMGGPTWSGLIMESNPPDDDHWLYTKAEIERPEGWEFFRQPGAVRWTGERWEFNPEAENVENHKLGREYWMRQIPGKTHERIRVYLGGEYGSMFTGRPVYSTWKDVMHASRKPLPVLRGLPLLLGWDFGLTPACVAAQLTPFGQLRVLREWVSDGNMGLQQLIDVVKPDLVNKFPGLQTQSWPDPAGRIRYQGDVLTPTCEDILRANGFPVMRTPTNEFTVRREAVLWFLGRMVEDGAPAFLLDPSCRLLRKGFNGGYRFSRVSISGDERYKDVPDKNEFSHVHDALQYLALGARYPQGAVQGKAWKERRRMWA